MVDLYVERTPWPGYSIDRTPENEEREHNASEHNDRAHILCSVSIQREHPD